MKAFYDPKPDCVMCMDMENWRPADFTCAYCKKILREEVDVLTLGAGIFADKAIIKKADKSLKTVPMSTITLID